MNRLLLSAIVLCLSTGLTAQRDLKRVSDDATAILEGISGTTNSIERASVSREDERSVTVSLRFTGYDDKDYSVQLAILDQRKEVMDMISTVETDMPRNRQIDIALNLSDSGKAISSSTVTSKYFRVRVGPKESGVTGVLDDFLSDFNPRVTEYVFELDKKWMVMGSSVKLNATLSPYKNAGAISPN